MRGSPGSAVMPAHHHSAATAGQTEENFTRVRCVRLALTPMLPGSGAGGPRRTRHCFGMILPKLLHQRFHLVAHLFFGVKYRRRLGGRESAIDPFCRGAPIGVFAHREIADDRREELSVCGRERTQNLGSELLMQFHHLLHVGTHLRAHCGRRRVRRSGVLLRGCDGRHGNRERKCKKKAFHTLGCTPRRPGIG
jgi:hypothetical protein